MIPSTSGDYDIGSNSKRWDNLYLSGLLTGSRISLSGNLVMSSGILTAGTLHSNGETQINGTLDHDGDEVGFFGKTPIAQHVLISSAVATVNGYGSSNPFGAVRGLATTVDGIISLLKGYGLMAS